MKGMRIRPEKQGLKTSLFDLEADIMEIVWSKYWEIFSVGDVHSILDQCRDIAYTTVMTTVSRLYDKGLLDRKKMGSAIYIFLKCPAKSFWFRPPARLWSDCRRLDKMQRWPYS